MPGSYHVPPGRFEYAKFRRVEAHPIHPLRAQPAGRDEPYLVALYMMGMGLITVVATWFARETYRSDIGDVRADERSATGRFMRKPAEDRESTAVR